MKLIKSKNNQCVLASFAMLLDTSMEELQSQLGHDGLQVIFESDPPACYRSFHPQEFVDVCLQNGHALTMIELDPLMKHGDHIVNHADFIGKNRFFKSLFLGDGVIFGYITESSVGHAVAWNSLEKKIYDPRGYTYPWSEGQDFMPKQFFLYQKIEG